MKEYLVNYRYDGQVSVVANSKEEAEEIAREEAIYDVNLNGILEVFTVHELVKE